MSSRIVAVLLLAAVLCACFWGCESDPQGEWHSGLMRGEQQTHEPNSDNDASDETEDQSGVQEGQQTEDSKPEDWTSPTRDNLEVTLRMDTSYEKMLAAGVLMGLSMQYPDFQLEELCFKEEHDFEDKMKSDGVYAFFQSGGENICIHAKPLAELRKEEGACDLQETILGYATFDIVDVSLPDLNGYISVMNEDLSEQISQLYLLTIIEN